MMNDITHLQAGASHANNQAVMQTVASLSVQAQQSGDAPRPAGETKGNTEDQGLTFFDFLDIINPLQHIPIISNIYRAITGDEMSSTARFIGDSLYMGPIGAASSIINIALEESTGDDIVGHVASLFFEDQDDAEPSSIVAENQPAQSNQTVVQAQLGNQTQAMNAPLNPGAVFTFPQAPVGQPNAGLSAPPMPAQTSHMQGVQDTAEATLQPAAASNLESTSLTSFNATSQPVALEYLPADILAALYSGAPLNTGLKPLSAHTNETPDMQPRWNLWNNLEQQTERPEKTAAQESIPLPLYPNAIVGVLNSYENSANLGRQTQKTFINLYQ